MPSTKTGLHILAEKGNCEVTRLLLDRFSDRARRAELLGATVHMELEGQRPRDLASIHIAALRGHKDLVELFVKDYNVNVNSTNKKNDSPVLWAARGNQVDTVRRLIQLRADLQLENDKGSTPLYWAVRYGYIDLVRILLVEGQVNVHQRRKLGLVTPIVLAAAIGRADIVDVLLENDAYINATSNNGLTALMAAASEGNNDVVELLLNKQADPDQIDASGNTALLHAARAGNILMMATLINHGAAMERQNRIGETVWHYAIRRPDEKMLMSLIALYRKTKKIDSQKLQFANGRSPLHVAVTVGSFAKLRCLLDLGVDQEGTDLNGNTYFHLAAQDGKMDILNEFINVVDVNRLNSDGDTALHLAAKSGHVHAVELLLPKSKLEKRNKEGETPLHKAAGSECAVPILIRTMIDVIVKANNWSLVDAVDGTGNTALHVAARRGKPEVFPELAKLNPKNTNSEGDTPFHLSARFGQPYCIEAMLDVFNRPQKGFNIDERNAAGDSILHICARRGDAVRVELLVAAGADLQLQNRAGNTPLHVVVEESVREPAMMEAFLEVIRACLRSALRWRCVRTSSQQPTEDSELYYRKQRSAILHLTSEVFNDDGLNVISMATVVGAVPIIQELLNTPNVYLFREADALVYDITYLTPQTTTRVHTVFVENFDSLATTAIEPVVGRSTSKKSRVGVMKGKEDTITKSKSVVTTDVDVTVTTGVRPTSDSCLDLIVSLDDEVLASKILDISPFKQLVRNYWKSYQWLYVVLMLVHIVHMSIFTTYVLPNSIILSTVYNDSTVQCHRMPSYNLYGLFLIWPCIILAFLVYYTFSSIIRFIRCSPCCCGTAGRRCGSSSCGGKAGCLPAGFSFSGLPFLVTSGVFSYLSQLSALSFGVMSIVWYALYRCGTTAHVYVEVVAAVFTIGWMFTLQFTKGFEAMHAFSIMLKHIVVRDITRFLLMYVFVLLGFGLAFHALFQIDPAITAEYGTSMWNTLFSIFNLMLGLGSPLDAQFDETYQAVGGNPAFVKWIYILYIALATIILLSLLIAMMTDTFTDIKSKEGTTWQVGSLRLALRIEHSIPILKSVFRSTASNEIEYDKEAKRWMMSVPSKEVGAVRLAAVAMAKGDQAVDEMLKVVLRLENKLDHLQYAYVDLTSQVEEVAEVVRRGAGAAEGGALAGIRRAPAAAKLYNIAMMLRARPVSATSTRSRPTSRVSDAKQ